MLGSETVYFTLGMRMRCTQVNQLVEPEIVNGVRRVRVKRQMQRMGEQLVGHLLHFFTRASHYLLFHIQIELHLNHLDFLTMRIHLGIL